MTNEERIELCLKRLSMGKTSDVMNFSYADTLAYIERLKAENAELHARLEKMVRLIDPRIVVDHWGGLYEVVHDEVKTVVEAYETQREAEARVAELKGGKE